MLRLDRDLGRRSIMRVDDNGTELWKASDTRSYLGAGLKVVSMFRFCEMMGDWQLQLKQLQFERSN